MSENTDRFQRAHTHTHTHTHGSVFLTCQGTRLSVHLSVYLLVCLPVSGGDAVVVFLSAVVTLLPVCLHVPVPPVSLP